MSIGFPHSQVDLNVSPRREKAVLFKDPSLQLPDEFVGGVRYILHSLSRHLQADSDGGAPSSGVMNPRLQWLLPATQMTLTSPGFIQVQLVLAKFL